MALFHRKKNTESSHSGHDDNDDGGKTKGSWKRPANTAFKQQRLKAWQPILTPKSVLPTFFILGLLFAPIGGLLVWGSGLVTQITIDYTDCESQPPSSSVDQLNFTAVKHFNYRLADKDSKASINSPQWAFFDNSSASGDNVAEAKSCFLQFDIPADLGPSVFLYYKLTNFYQNHRRYVKSLDTNQLKGDAVSAGSLKNGDCSPLDVNSEGKAIYPCGLIANSLFNDTLLSPVLMSTDGSQNSTYDFSPKGIAWPGEAKKYGTPTKYNIDDIVPPPNWVNRFPGGKYTNDTLPKLHEDEHFQNWMRTAGLPTFTKLFGRNDNDKMTKGRYQMQIFLNFPVTPYGGTKSVVISTVSWVGGKNPFLGWAYVGASGLLILLAVAGTIRHCIRARPLGDMSQLSWNQAGAR